MKTIIKEGVGNFVGLKLKPGAKGTVTFFDGETQLYSTNLTNWAIDISEKIANLTSREETEQADALKNDGEFSVLNFPFETNLSVEGTYDEKLLTIITE